MTIDTLFIVLAFFAGIVLGLFYFGTLWLVVRRLPSSRRPVLLVLGSFFLRMTFTLAGFYFVFGDSWQRLVLCLLGFLASRTYLIRVFGPAGLKPETEGGKTYADNPR